MTQMSPSRVEDISSGGGWGVGFGGTAKTRAVLSGAHAQTQLKETEPVFYFYFAKAEANLGSMDISATSPDDYALGGYHAGLNKKDIRPFTSEKISDGIFKVTPATLKPGEYAFVQLAGARMVTALKMFDFGIAGVGSK